MALLALLEKEAVEASGDGLGDQVYGEMPKSD